MPAATAADMITAAVLLKSAAVKTPAARLIRVAAPRLIRVAALPIAALRAAIERASLMQAC